MNFINPLALTRMAKDGSRPEARFLVYVRIETVILVCVVYIQALLVGGAPSCDSRVCWKANLLQTCVTFIIAYWFEIELLLCFIVKE